MSCNFDAITQDDNNFTNMNIKDTTEKSLCQKMKEYESSIQMVEVISCIALGLILAYVPTVIVPINQRPIPYQMTNQGDVLLDLTKYQEYVDDTVPTILNILICFIMPAFLQLTLSFWCGEPNDIHLTICVYAIANGLTKAITNIFKNYVGYLRPNFYNRCKFDADTLLCNDEEEEQNARKSFPSGHSSLAFCGMTLLTLYLLHIFGVGGVHDNASSQKQRVGKRFLSLLCLLPMMVSFFVAASRVHDNYHHPADVVAGSLIGFGCAKVVHGIWFFSYES